MIRPMRFEDLRRVAEIHIAAWRLAYRGILSDSRLAALDLDEQTELWESTLYSRKTHTNIVVLEDDKILGWSTFGAARDDDENYKQVGEVYGLHVLPDVHRRGLGTALLSHAHRHFRDRHYREAVIWVVDENHRARSFYEQRRYTIDASPHAHKYSEWLGTQEMRYRRKI